MNFLNLSGLTHFLTHLKVYVANQIIAHNSSSLAHDARFKTSETKITTMQNEIISLKAEIESLKKFNGRVLFVSPEP